MPFSKDMLAATEDTGWLVLNIKNRVAKSGPLQGQRHPYVYQLVIALQHQGWHWLEPYIWSKPNAVPGRYGPRTKDGRLSRGIRPRTVRAHWYFTRSGTALHHNFTVRFAGCAKDEKFKLEQGNR